MDKVVLLKTHLEEAAKFSLSKRFGHKRLAVILLDNFVEIQLNGIIRDKFTWDGIFNLVEKKYSQKRRVIILNHYDELLNTCIKEGLISSDEQRLLLFCHSVRNNLYHKGDEEKILTQIAIIILSNIIIKHQTSWKSARGFTRYSQDIIDPYRPTKEGKPLPGNSDKDWKSFLNTYFICVDKRIKKPSKLLSDFLIAKVKEIRTNINFIKKESKLFYPIRKDWDYNMFLLHYSFLYLKHNEIEYINENKNKVESKKQHEKLFLSYRSGWRCKKQSRLKAMENSFKELAKLPIEKSIEKFISYKNEIDMIYEAFNHAARDLDFAIQNAIDRARGK